MPRWIIPAIAAAIVAARAAIFLVWPESYFDSDQAIVGLMAKHLSELRAFPVFLYGQTYMLGVEAWLAAPLFAIFGVSATVLKLPLLAMNVVIAMILVTVFQREMGLSPAKSLIAALPFVLPSTGLAAVMMDSSGGSLEPFLYVVLLWIVRRRPVLCGLALGIGFLNREFTIYGFAALLVLDLVDRTIFSRDTILRWARVAAVAAVVWIAVQGLKQVSSGAGPGTTIAQTFTASNNLAELARRTCVSPARAISGAGRLFTVHWPAILGTAPLPLTSFSIESAVSQGIAGSSWLPAVVVLLCAAGIVTSAPRIDLADRRPRFAQYLILAGLFSVAGYLFGRCGQVNFLSMRYELLSVLAIAGGCAWLLAVRPPAVILGAWAIAFAAWMAVIVIPHVRFGMEYASHPPVPAKEELIHALRAQHVRYGTADYWLAYYIDFMTRERMIFASTSPQRILEYNSIVAAHADEAVTLSRRPCAGGVELVRGVFRCP